MYCQMTRRLAQLLGSVIMYGVYNEKRSEILFRWVHSHNILFLLVLFWLHLFNYCPMAYNKREHLKILFKRKGNASLRERCYLSTPNSGNLRTFLNIAVLSTHHCISFIDDTVKEQFKIMFSKCWRKNNYPSLIWFYVSLNWPELDVIKLKVMGAVPMWVT